MNNLNFLYICPLKNTNKAIDKLMKKKNIYNGKILEALEKEFGFSIDYIRKSLRGDRSGIMPDKICARYKSLDNVASKAIENEMNN